MTNLTADEKARVDTSMLLGFEQSNLDGALFTRIEDDISVQMAYTFVKPISKMRSVDGEDNSILAFQPTAGATQRVREWKEGSESEEYTTLSPPMDVRICEEGVELLLRINSTYDKGRDEEHIEIQTPPLDQDGATLVAQELGRHGIVVTNGVGRVPFVTCGEVDLDQYLSDV